MKNQKIITRVKIKKDLRTLGLRSGDVVMLHASVKAIGWVVGGPDVVIQSILDVITPEGTLMMMVGWEDSPYEFDSWSKERQQAYLDECPAFNPQRSRAVRDWSILTEYLRTWPNACRSNHPDQSFAAVGKLTEWITADHPLQYGLGLGSPLAKLCDVKGKVLLLGSPLYDITLLHHSEVIANIKEKPVIRYTMPVLQNNKRVWVEIEEFDTNKLIGNWTGESYFHIIPREAIKVGIGIKGQVGNATSYLFDAHALNQFAITWFEKYLV